MFRLQQTRSIFLLAKTGPLYAKNANIAQLKQAFRPLKVNSAFTKILANGSRPQFTRYTLQTIATDLALMYIVRFKVCLPFQSTFIFNRNHGSITREDKEGKPPVITTIKKVSGNILFFSNQN